MSTNDRNDAIDKRDILLATRGAQDAARQALELARQNDDTTEGQIAMADAAIALLEAEDATRAAERVHSLSRDAQDMAAVDLPALAAELQECAEDLAGFAAMALETWKRVDAAVEASKARLVAVRALRDANKAPDLRFLRFDFQPGRDIGTLRTVLADVEARIASIPEPQAPVPANNQVAIEHMRSERRRLAGLVRRGQTA